MEDNDTLREILGFFAMMVGSLFDPIALPCYIAIGVFFRKFAVALAVAVGFNIAFRVIIAAIRSNTEAGVETGSPDFEVIAASLVGACLVAGIANFCASKYRKSAKNETKPDA